MLTVKMVWRNLRLGRLTAILIAVVVTLSAALVTVADLEGVMATIQAMTNAPGDEIALLYGLARQISKERRISAAEAARWIAAELAAGRTSWSLLHQSAEGQRR